ncbi:MAG TPA: bifunctional riboflavin kinase/FAD synthetase [Candidatus Limnocylindria bacterium]|nr:bifunctional riboflavin kinase/FAD synthetase [Candidatus Limnocylindria bacterium]
MKIHHALSGAPSDERARVVAIGFFDGFHRGHRAIAREALRLRRAGERSAVLTFRAHPTAFLRPGQEPPLIATLEERVNAFARAGFDEAYVLEFDASIASLSPQAFLDDVLVGRIGARAMVVGATFRFGHKRAGDVAFAQEHLGEQGRTVVAVPNEVDGGERVSSTRVRAAILEGDLETADRLLGASYTVRGAVTFGAGRGHDLGFPTANIAVPPNKLLPPDGVYRIIGRHDGREYPGLVSIGTNPTFDGRARTVEAWLLDFRGALYGEELALRDFRFVRGQRKFASVDELVAQMHEDAATVRFPSVSA